MQRDFFSRSGRWRFNTGIALAFYFFLACGFSASCLADDASSQAQIKELMKDVPEKEITDFLNDAVALESNDTDALMN